MNLINKTIRLVTFICFFMFCFPILASATSVSFSLKNDTSVIQKHNDLIPEGSWKLQVVKHDSGMAESKITCNGSPSCPEFIQPGEIINIIEMAKDPKWTPQMSVNLESPGYSWYRFHCT